MPASMQDQLQKTIKNIKRKSEVQWHIIEGLDHSLNILKQIREEKDKKNLQLEEDVLKTASLT